MALSARLERLNKLLQADLDALPDRPISSGLESLTLTDDVHGAPIKPQGPETLPANQPVLSDTNTRTKEAPTVAEASTERRFVWLKDAISTYKPDLSGMRQPPPPANFTELPVTDLRRGDLASARCHFTPIQALARYPYKYCDKSHMQDIASAFFDQGKFWQRSWDLYYVWDFESTKSIVLVRESQVQTLLKEINTHLKLSLKITNQQREEGLLTQLPDHPRCLPRYLGRSHTRQDFDNMVNQIPSSSFRAPGEATHPPLRDGRLQAFKQLMEDLSEVQKAKNKASKTRKQQERLGKQKSMADQFKRAQRYLGLRASAVMGAAHPGSQTSIDPSLAVPFLFERSVVFVCVDVESYERAHNKITEVGVATLDTRDLIGVAPGVDGENWRSRIRARHFLIKEHRHLVNHEFVNGYPDGFDFGTSDDISLKEAAQKVGTCFVPPFGAHPSNGAEAIYTFDLSEKRNIIFLGHDTLADVRYLQQLGYDPMKVENILEALDTAVMYRVWRREHQATSLGKILNALDIAGFKLHNAGNDAVFTVQAMLAICVREATIRGSPELNSMRQEEKTARLAAAVVDAQQKATDEAEGWSDNEAAGDGGVPVSLAMMEAPRLSSPQPSPHIGSQHHGSFDSVGRGNGRGRGLWIPSEHGYSNGTVRGGHQGSGRGQPGRHDSTRGQGRSRGRARGRGSASPSPRSTTTREPNVTYDW